MFSIVVGGVGGGFVAVAVVVLVLVAVGAAVALVVSGLLLVDSWLLFAVLVRGCCRRCPCCWYWLHKTDCGGSRAQDPPSHAFKRGTCDGWRITKLLEQTRNIATIKQTLNVCMYVCNVCANGFT